MCNRARNRAEPETETWFGDGLKGLATDARAIQKSDAWVWIAFRAALIDPSVA